MVDTLEDIKEYVKDTCHYYFNFNNGASSEDALIELASNSGYSVPEYLCGLLQDQWNRLELHVFVVYETINDNRRLIILYDNNADPDQYHCVGLYKAAPCLSECSWEDYISECLNDWGIPNLDAWRGNKEQVDKEEEVKQDVMSITRGMFR